MIKDFPSVTENFEVRLTFKNAATLQQARHLSLRNLQAKDISYLYKETHKIELSSHIPNIKTLWLTEDHLALIVDSNVPCEYNFSRPHSSYLKMFSRPYFGRYYNQQKLPSVLLKYNIRNDVDLSKTKIVSGQARDQVRLTPIKGVITPRKKLRLLLKK